MESKQKKKINSIVVVVAVVFIALASITFSVFLYKEYSLEREELAWLKNKLSSLESSTSRMNDDISLMGKKFENLATVEFPTLKNDIKSLKETEAEDEPVFTVTGFDDSSRGTIYNYRNHTESFDTRTGIGTIQCSNKFAYLVTLKITSSSDSHAQEQIICVYVVDGAGKFSTFDWGFMNYLSKPSYQFEILGLYASHASGSGRSLTLTK